MALVNGALQKVANYNVEVPGLFMGRGEHPKAGKIKYRIRPEDVTINIGKGEKAPKAPDGHRWKGVVHNQRTTGLAFWTDNIMQRSKYVYLHASSEFKGLADWGKYQKARELKVFACFLNFWIRNVLVRFAKIIRTILSAKVILFPNEQLPCTLSINLHFVLGICFYFESIYGRNEKDTSEEADTVGCCSLRVEHVKVLAENQVEFDFLGKDSMRYHNLVTVDPQVHKNIKRFVTGKRPTEDVFDTLEV